jgi:L-alanine-DL-glutamate epimerase-like enolase superfamily enzyme
MNIDTVECALFRLPVPENVADSAHGALPCFELVCAKVRDREGTTGLGCTYTLGRGGSAVLAMLRDDLTPLLLGQDADAIERLWEVMWRQTHYVGRGGIAAYAMSVIDLALWDLKARRSKLPLWRLLGGYDPRVPAYGSGTNLLFSRDDLLAQMHGFLQRGLRAVKMKVGRPNLEEDLDRVASVREAIGSGVSLMVDANMQWDVATAVRAARELGRLDVAWLEEPIDPDDLPGLVRVIREGGLPVSAGENYHTVHEFERVLAIGGLSVAAVDVCNVGGVTPFLKVAALAAAHHVPVTVHGIEEPHLHLLAAIPNRSLLMTGMLNGALEPFRSRRLEISDGCVVAPDTPGHGLELDWDRLAPYSAEGGIPCTGFPEGPLHAN